MIKGVKFEIKRRGKPSGQCTREWGKGKGSESNGIISKSRERQERDEMSSYGTEYTYAKWCVRRHKVGGRTARYYTVL